MGCNNKISHTCASTTYATCARYEGETNTQSELSSESCLSLEQTTADIYDQLEKIIVDSDLSALGNQCLEYTTVEGKIFVKNAFLAMEAKICELENKVTELENTAFCSMPLTNCGLDFECLTDACNNDITTVGELLQALITKSCTP